MFQAEIGRIWFDIGCGGLPTATIEAIKAQSGLDNVGKSYQTAVKQAETDYARANSRFGQNAEYLAQIDASNLVDASEEKAPIWFTNRGLQLPKLVQTIIGADNSIHQNYPIVNSSGEKSSFDDTERLNLDTDNIQAVKDQVREKATIEQLKKSFIRIIFITVI